MRVFTPKRVGYAARWDSTVKRGDQLAKVIPILLEQTRLGKGELTGRLPVAAAGADYSNDPPPHYSDPVGEGVVNGRRAPEYDDLEAAVAFLAALDVAADAIDGLDLSIRALMGRSQAMRDAVAAGSSPRDGRARHEREQTEFVHAHDDQACMIGEDHSESDLFGPGQLRRGMCNRHRMAFRRWHVEMVGDEENTFAADLVVRWRAETWPEAWDGEPLEEQPAVHSPYKTLRRVA